jgi:hypothetical protein
MRHPFITVCLLILSAPAFAGATLKPEQAQYAVIARR